MTDTTKKIKEEEKSEFIGQIIDIFEDFLEERKIRIPTSDKEMQENGDDNENTAIIYGMDYGEMQTNLENLMDEWKVTE